MDSITRIFADDSVGLCAEVLDFWLYECSLEAAPTAVQVAQWRDCFRQRGGAFVRLADVCQQWLDEGQGAVHECL